MSYKVFAVIISAAMLCTMLAGCKDKAEDNPFQRWRNVNAKAFINKQRHAEKYQGENAEKGIFIVPRK